MDEVLRGGLETRFLHINFTNSSSRRVGCHVQPQMGSGPSRRVVIVGSPNVGKSVIFNALTGAYVTVSNYPGTTIEVSRGKGRIGDREFTVIDTPGIYSLLPITEDERVAKSILLGEESDVVIHVVDAKNLERMLPLTLQLIEAGLPLILDLNMADEAERRGIKVDIQGLEERLGIPVVQTVATTGQGIDLLRRRITEFLQGRWVEGSRYQPKYDRRIETSLREIERLLEGRYPTSKRSIALLLLQGDQTTHSLVKAKEGHNYHRIQGVVEATRTHYNAPLSYVIAVGLQEAVSGMVAHIMTIPPEIGGGLSERLSGMMMNPITGIPFLLLILYLGLYQFVGVFGAQVAVDFFEEVVFGVYINPFVTEAISSLIPYTVLQDLFVGEYGIITLGVRYAVAIILPIVATFFIAFSIIEDSGYLPRMAMLIDRVFKKIGLNGRAVIPMTLGFGCDTMATMVTRTLETKRERVIATLLLALAIPCSAQLGVLLAILVGNLKATLIWAGVLITIFLFVGFLTSQILPGERPSFYMEIPPLRVPKLSNVLIKTYARVKWYLLEVFPLFILASLLIWIGRVTGLFDLMIGALAYPVQWIGLPREAAVSFLFGFFRRDYGAAGLYDLQQTGVLSGNSLLVSAVTMTLFVPCIAQFSVNIKERGWRTALGMALFIFPFAFIIGFLFNVTLNILGVQL